jgi:hypothetical protein
LNPALKPAGVVTTTEAVPGVPGGAIACISVDEKMVKELAILLANITAVALSRFKPVMVTIFPPNTGPDAGVSPVTVGGRMAV